MSESQLQIPVDESGELSGDLQSIAERARVFASASKSEATKDAYRADFAHFSNWCVEHDFACLPARPDAVAFYLTQLADEGYATATIARRVVAISQAHQLSDLPSPTTNQTVREVLKGIRRKKKTAQLSKRPILTVELRRIIQQLGDALIDLRDAALLLVGFAGGLRRSEIVGLDVADMEKREQGLVLHLRRSKTDQEGEGQIVGLPHGRHQETCPVAALESWLTEADISAGPIFRSVSKGGAVSGDRLSGRSVALIVKRHIESIGLNPERYGGHSLRSGFATEAARNGAAEREIMKQTRHRSRKVVRRYIQEGGAFIGNAANKLGL